MQTLKKLFLLFFVFFKVGLFTFGGGYAMIAMFNDQLVERKKWLSQDEFLDIISIAESTPGPIAVNTATFVGYKIGKVLGSVFATLGVVLPSFIIIFIISLFFDRFLSLTFVAYAFRGIQSAVAFIILVAGIKMFAKSKKNVFSVILFSAVICCMIAFTLFSVKFSSVFYIIAGGFIGLIIYLISLVKGKLDKKGEK